MTTDVRRLAAACGVVGPVVTLGSILLATMLADPQTFTWSGRALSDMGRPGTETFWLFNGGLVAGGLVGLPFAWRLWIAGRNRLERVGVGCLALALAGSALVGVFFLEHTDYYLETDLHGPVALWFFGVAPIAQWILGAGAVLAGDRRWGAFTIAAGTGHVLTWLAWLAYLAIAAGSPMAWFAVPELIAALLFGGWVVLAAVRVLTDRP